MSTELETKLNLILNEKTTKIIPENIKKDVQIFNITGTYEGSSPVGLGKLQSNNETLIQCKETIEPKYYKDFIRQLDKMMPALTEMKTYYNAHSEDIDYPDDFWNNSGLTEERKQEIQEVKDTYSELETNFHKKNTIDLYMKYMVSVEEESGNENEEESEEEYPENEGEFSINFYAPVAIMLIDTMYLYLDVDHFQTLHDYFQWLGNIDMIYEDQDPFITGWYIINTTNESDIKYQDESDLMGILIHKAEAPSVHLQNPQISTMEDMCKLAYLDETTVNACIESMETDNIAKNIQVNLKNVDEYVVNGGSYYVAVYEEGGSPSEPIVDAIPLHAVLNGTKPVDISFVIPNTEDTDIVLGLYSDSDGLAHNFTINTDDNISQIIDIDISGYSINEDVSL